MKYRLFSSFIASITPKIFKGLLSYSKGATFTDVYPGGTDRVLLKFTVLTQIRVVIGTRRA